MAAHYIKPNHRTESPANYLFFACSAAPYPVPHTKGVLQWRWRHGAAITLRMEKGNITRHKCHDLPTPDHLWQLIANQVNPRRPLYVIGYNLAHTWRLAGGWEWLEGQRPGSWKIIISNPPIMFRGKVNDCTCAVLDAYNWFPLELDVIGRSLGIDRHPGASHTASNSNHYLSALVDCQIMAGAFAGLVSWWRANDLGVLGKTLAGSAMNAFRHRFMPTGILHHDIEDCFALERNCYYGGELTVSKIGNIGGETYELDVSSLYPSVMRACEYPHKLIRYCEQGSLQWLNDRIGEYCCAANVIVRAMGNTYPLRRDKHTIYPEGCYQTYLCGCELEEAIERGDVLHVYQCACYQTADLFTEYVDFFWNMRMEARQRGRLHEELLAKSLLNSLYGKFAQRPMVWEAHAEMLPPNKWCQWNMKDDVIGKVREFRSIAGQVQELHCDGEPIGTCPIISAAITAYGRQRMRQLRAIAGHGNWHYQDTDSLLVNRDGFDNLLCAGEVRNNTLGVLKLENIIHNLTIHSPKWYVADGVSKHSGVKLGADPLPQGQVGQWMYDTIVDGMRRHSEPHVYSTYTRMDMPKCKIQGDVDANGNVRPLTILDALDYDFELKEKQPGRLDRQRWWDLCEELLLRRHDRLILDASRG